MKHEDFAIRNLAVLSYAQGFTMWHYKAPGGDKFRLVFQPEFWASVIDMIGVGDIIMCTHASDGAAMIVMLKRPDQELLQPTPMASALCVPIITNQRG